MSRIAVPDSILDHLKCTLCEEFLSHLPVMTNEDGGLTCGRCSGIHGEAMQGRQERAYEIVAELLLFPCRYHNQGCLDQYTPKNIKNHEESCQYRTYFCPSLPLGTCHWQGLSTELLNHYETSHKVLILNDDGFELDLVRQYDENMMLSHGEQLFILQIKCDQTVKKTWFSVRQIGTINERQFYTYQMQLTALGENEQREILDAKPVEDDKSMVLNRDKATQLGIDEFAQMFDNPPSIFCKVDIQLKDQESSSKESSGCEVEWDRSSLPPDVLNVTGEFMRSLECPVCTECMVPPILQCLNGHSLCSPCKEGVADCPMCHAEFANVRNFALENLTAFIPYTCKFQDYGCVFLTTATKVRAHEAECKYGPYNCPLQAFEECEWKGKLENVMEHTEEEHEDYVYDMGYILNITLADRRQPEEFYYIFQCGRDVFRLCFKKDENLNCFFAVQLYGPSNEAVNFMYELDFVDPVNNNNRKMRHFLRIPCEPYTKEGDVFENAVNYPHQTLKRFMVDHDIQYKCKVTRV